MPSKKSKKKVKALLDEQEEAKIKELLEASYYNAAAGLVHKPRDFDDEEKYPPKVLTAEECSRDQYNVNGFYVSSVEDESIKTKIDRLHYLLRKDLVVGRHKNNEKVFNTYSYNDADLLRKRYPKVDNGRVMLKAEHLHNNKLEREIYQLISMIGKHIQEKIFHEIHIEISDAKAEGMVYSLLETAAPVKAKGGTTVSYDEVFSEVYYIRGIFVYSLR